MRRAAKIDANQPEIIAALRAIGCSVQPLHGVGQGVPDLVAAKHGRNVMIEIKDGSKPRSARQLTDDQIEWIAAWRGEVRVVSSIEEALAVFA